jgi:hypothetical protein
MRRSIKPLRVFFAGEAFVLLFDDEFISYRRKSAQVLSRKSVFDETS